MVDLAKPPWFATDMAYFRGLDRLLELAWLGIRFVELNKSFRVEETAIWLMPQEFARAYVRERTVTHPKEAFRRIWFRGIQQRVPKKLRSRAQANGQLKPTEAAIVDHFRKHKRFQLADLGVALGHPPSKTELAEAQRFLSALSDKDWPLLLR